MESYQKLTLELIPGNTPREKYENMKRIAELINDLAFPKRGEERYLIEFVELACEIIEEPIKIK